MSEQSEDHEVDLFAELDRQIVACRGHGRDIAKIVANDMEFRNAARGYATLKVEWRGYPIRTTYHGVEVDLVPWECSPTVVPADTDDHEARRRLR